MSTALREKTVIVSWIVLLASAAVRADEADAHFDGAWATTLSCTATVGALGYVYQFTTHVKDGVLHGEKGIEGTPGWLELDGKIGCGRLGRNSCEGAGRKGVARSRAPPSRYAV